MNIESLFADYSDDFELTFVDDDWKRLEQYFSHDAAYSTSGFHVTRFEG